jgi:ribose transport system substrate-binding protein
VSRLVRRYLLAASLLLAAGTAANAAGPLSIAMVARGSRDPFSRAVMEGALRASRDYGVTVTFEGPENEPLAEAQAALMSAALERKPSAVCIDALDASGVIPLLQKAQKARIPVIAFDTGIESPIPVTTAATDNSAAGALAAYKLAALVGGSGKVGVLVDDPSRPASVDRRDGFIGELSKRYPGIQVIGPGYTRGDQGKSGELAKSMLQADPDIKGFFGADEGSALGIAQAVHGLGMAGAVAIVGFDSGKAQVEAVRSGLIAGAVIQDPIRLGYKAIEAAVSVLRGMKVPLKIDTGFHWFDRENIDDPAIAALLDQ